MDFYTIVITYWKYIVSGLVSACFLLVNIIQAVSSHNRNKLKEAICRVPEIIRCVEDLANVQGFASSTTATFKSAYKKATAESLLINEFGQKFFDKYKSVFDDAIEDILNTPQKKGGSDGISKENEKR